MWCSCHLSCILLIFAAAHGAGEPWKCPHPGCSKTLPSRMKVLRHEQTHRDKVMCDQCGAAVMPDYLTRHMNVSPTTSPDT